MSPLNWAQLIRDLRNEDKVDLAIRASETISAIADESHIPDLYVLLDDESFFVREAAADPLARLEGVKVLPALFRALTRGVQDGHDNDGLSFTISELLDMNRAAAAPVLLSMLEAADDPETRAHSAWALGFVRPEITAEPLLTLLSDPVAAVRAATAGSLSSFKNDQQVGDALIQALADSNEHVRISAAAALGYLGDKRAIQPLRDLLKVSGGNTREIVQYALKLLGAK